MSIERGGICASFPFASHGVAVVVLPLLFFFFFSVFRIYMCHHPTPLCILRASRRQTNKIFLFLQHEASHANGFLAPGTADYSSDINEEANLISYGNEEEED